MELSAGLALGAPPEGEQNCRTFGGSTVPSNKLQTPVRGEGGRRCAIWRRVRGFPAAAAAGAAGAFCLSWGAGSATAFAVAPQSVGVACSVINLSLLRRCRPPPYRSPRRMCLEHATVSGLIASGLSLSLKSHVISASSGPNPPSVSSLRSHDSLACSTSVQSTRIDLRVIRIDTGPGPSLCCAAARSVELSPLLCAAFVGAGAAH